MTDVPNNNTPANIANTVIGEGLKTLETIGEVAAETALPPLAAPIIKQVFEEGMDYLEENLDIVVEGLGTILIIKLEVWGETSGVNDAIRAFAVAYKKGPLHESDPVVQAIIASARAAGHFDGSAKQS